MNEDGSLFLLGRKSQIIRVAGVAVDPVEVERIIAMLPEVRDVAVVGVPHVEKGEVLKAVVAADGLTGADVVRHCQRFMEGITVPEIIEFRPALPRTPAGKILRRALRDPV
jgi:long-chain acyl-CoA synthetase